MMGLQFGLTARFRYVTEPWGEDVIYHFHRQISQIAVGLVATHALIMFATRPEMLALPSAADVPWGAVFAIVSLSSLIVLVVTALWRAKLNIRYETWHLTHIVLAVVAVAGGMAHMVGWAFYLTDPWKRALWIGLTIFWIGLLFYVRVIKPLFMLRRPYRVAEVRQERGDARTLVMRPDGHPGFRMELGAAVTQVIGQRLSVSANVEWARLYLRSGPTIDAPVAAFGTSYNLGAGARFGGFYQLYNRVDGDDDWGMFVSYEFLPFAELVVEGGKNEVILAKVLLSFALERP